jgi:hypothetical protein
VLRAFIDDSGSDQHSAWYVLAGYLGTLEDWDSFDTQWDTVLREAPSIPYFKSAEAERLRADGHWRGVTREERNAKIDSLIEVIGHFSRRAICARMRRNDYNELVKGKVPKMWDNPYYFLYTCIIGATVNIERLDGRGDEIDFVFDTDEEHTQQSNAMIPALLQMKSGWDSVVGIHRNDDKAFKPLQAADLLAWQIRRFFSANEPRRRHFDAARNAPPEDYHEFVIDRARTREIITGIQKRAAQLADSLGRSLDVRTWS